MKRPPMDRCALDRLAYKEANRIRGENAYLGRTQRYRARRSTEFNVFHSTSFVKGALYAFDLLQKEKEEI